MTINSNEFFFIISFRVSDKYKMNGILRKSYMDDFFLYIVAINYILFKSIITELYLNP